MADQTLLSDRRLIEQLIALVKRVRSQLQQNITRDEILHHFNLKLVEESLPLDKDGAYIPGEQKIIINKHVSSFERRQFTFYHEFVHYLLREEDEEIYAYLHDTYEDSSSFEKTIELLCNVGAAEFLVPRKNVRELINTNGFSLDLVPRLCSSSPVSGPAALIQLIQCAPHRCYGVVCMEGISPLQLIPDQQSLFQTFQTTNLYIVYATWSPSARYSIARWTVIPREHLLVNAIGTHELVSGEDRIPFRSGNGWPVPCQALSYRSSVLGGQGFSTRN